MLAPASFIPARKGFRIIAVFPSSICGLPLMAKTFICMSPDLRFRMIAIAYLLISTLMISERYLPGEG
jgi:hypothetical protein